MAPNLAPTLETSRVSLTLKLIAGALIAALTYTILIALLQRWKSRSYSRAPSPPTAPWWDLFGVTVPMALRRSLDEARMLEFMKGMQVDTSKEQGRRVTTFEVTLLGRKTFMTLDVKNVQAILAHQFSDFGLGEFRIGSFLPMLGVGIVHGTPSKVPIFFHSTNAVAVCIRRQIMGTQQDYAPPILRQEPRRRPRP